MGRFMASSSTRESKILVRGDYMSIWVCGKCKKAYRFDDFIKLEKVVLVVTDKDPVIQHGYTSKCPCGYVFGRDRYYRQTYHKIPLPEAKSLHIRISTVYLEMEHDKGYYYETMVFQKDDANEDPHEVRCEFQKRYKTQEEADRGHDKIIEMINDGKYKLVVSEAEIIIEDFSDEPPNRFDVLDTRGDDH